MYTENPDMFTSSSSSSTMCCLWIVGCFLGRFWTVIALDWMPFWDLMPNDACTEGLGIGFVLDSRFWQVMILMMMFWMILNALEHLLPCLWWSLLLRPLMLLNRCCWTNFLFFSRVAFCMLEYAEIDDFLRPMMKKFWGSSLPLNAS